METPICGVLMLDPSCYSPLKLVKRWGANSASMGGHLSMRSARNLGSYPREDSGFAVHPASAYADGASRPDTHADRNVGAAHI